MGYTDLGSSLTFSAQGGRCKEKIVFAEKTFCRSEDGSAGGGWGEERPTLRSEVRKAPPPARSEQSQAKYSFLFRRIFWWRAQIGKSNCGAGYENRTRVSCLGSKRTTTVQIPHISL